VRADVRRFAKDAEGAKERVLRIAKDAKAAKEYIRNSKDAKTTPSGLEVAFRGER
jgi:hypothetical protein